MRIGKLKIFYYGKIQKDKTPIIFFNWGPGQIWQELIKELAR